MVSNSQKLATQKYENKAYDKVLIRLKKDSELSKQNVQTAADSVGESLNGFITEAIRRRIVSETKTD